MRFECWHEKPVIFGNKYEKMYFMNVIKYNKWNLALIPLAVSICLLVEIVYFVSLPFAMVNEYVRNI